MVDITAQILRQTKTCPEMTGIINIILYHNLHIYFKHGLICNSKLQGVSKKGLQLEKSANAKRALNV